MPSIVNSDAASDASAAVSPAPTSSPGYGGFVNGTTTIPPASTFGDPSKLPHDGNQANIIACAILTSLVAAAFVAARFYTSIVLNKRHLSSSEWMLLVALLFSLAMMIPEIMEVTFGMGAHLYDIDPKVYNSIGIAEAEWISILFYSLSLTFSKLSILLLYIQIFYHTWIRPVSLALLAVVCLAQIWVLYVIFSACTPLQAFWDTALMAAGATCHPQTYWLSNQYLLIATDFLIFLLPIPVVWTLNVRFRQKCLLLSLFALGFFVCIISIIRIVLLMPLLANSGLDPTYNSTPAFYWTFVETNLSIVIASAITLKPLISRFMPRLLSTHPYYRDTDGAGAAVSTGAVRSRSGHHGLLQDPLATFGSLPTRPVATSETTAEDPPYSSGTQTRHKLHMQLDSSSTNNIIDKTAVVERDNRDDKDDKEAAVNDQRGTRVQEARRMSSEQTLRG